jgi:hypothetical protein
VRYLNSAVLLMVIGSASAFACGGNSASISANQGGSAGMEEGGAGGAQGGTGAKGGNAGAANNGGSGGTPIGGGAGAAGEGGAGQPGAAGEPNAAGEGGAAGEAPQGDSLQVTISGVPAGNVATATIVGPSSFSQNISTTTTLSSLEPGSYTVTAPPIEVDGAQVNSVFEATITGSPANVAPGVPATATVSYAPRPGTGMLWVTNFATRNAFGFGAAELAKTGSQADAPDVSLTLPNLGTNSPAAISLAFSASGDAWVGYCKNGQQPQVIAKFARAKLGASGSPSADVKITLPSRPPPDTSYDCASALAFDGSGNLWVGMYHGHVLRYDASDLLVSGTPAPAVTLTNSVYFSAILDMAFDANGNLFVGPYAYPAIARLSASQLTADTANIVPNVVLSLAAGTGIGGLSFGPGGDLWVADYGHFSLLRLKASDLTTTGTPVPSVTLTGVSGPEQLAFDNAGNLWVASYDSSSVFAYGAADLGTSGAPAPLTTLTGGGALSSTFGLRFDNPSAP